MERLTPSFLLTNAGLVQAAAPWCRRYDNLELALLLLAQPWIAGEGLRRADLERRLSELADEMPLGPIYFQRVSRAASALEEAGALAGQGSGRNRSFVATAKGFAGFIVNLRVLHEDPTLDGSEFELKRALVAMWNLLAERLQQLPGGLAADPAWEEFFSAVEAVTVFGKPVVTEELMAQAMDVQQLIAEQKENIVLLSEEAIDRLKVCCREADSAREVDLSFLAGAASSEDGGEGKPFQADAETRRMIQGLACRTLPELAQRAVVERYEAYAGYLDRLSALYREHLQVVPLEVFRPSGHRAGGGTS